MRHAVVVWMVVWTVVLGLSEMARAVDPPRTADAYVVLGLHRTKLKNLGFIGSGYVGANEARQKTSDGVYFGRGVFMSDGTGVAGDYVRLGVSTSVWDTWTNTFAGPASDIRNDGPVSFSLPIIPNLPPLPAFAPGTTDILVPFGQSVVLPPGASGHVRVLNGGTLIVNAGSYELLDLVIGKTSKVLIYGPVTMNIQRDLRIGNVSTFGPAGPGFGPSDIKVNVGGRKARFGASSNITMYLYAPNAYLGISRTVQVKGQFIAATVNSDHSPIFSHPFCGDGTVDPGEQCDDGNTLACDGCDPHCVLETCGDGVTCPALGEQCDDGNTTGCDGCSATCQTESCGDGVVCAGTGETCDPPTCGSCGPTCQAGPTCGDGIVDAACGEQCDDGNTNSCDGCSSACKVETCGDGVVCAALGEQCDDGNTNACDGCSATCKNETCGDGELCPSLGEQCDDGNTTPCDGCSPTCKTDTCGDGITCASEGEMCDDGNTTPCDGCSPTCHMETCGDGELCPSLGEQCDDGNAVSCDGCSPTCQTESCGDGIVCPSQGEQCDPPTGGACGLCTATCQNGPSCGDGVVDAACGEQCDDGNNTPCDGCTACKVDTCGDGVTCPALGETCDDGNTNSCDGCSSSCHVETCGDGIVCASQGETCDDGNHNACDGCSPTCKTETCGDGVVCASQGETCDDGNHTACDGCSPTCKTETCGDGVVCASQGETCDDGNTTACDGCSPTCKTESCGDGIVCPSEGEQCDDGNAAACDGCSPTCTVERCGDGVVCASQGEVCDDGNINACDGCSATCQPETCGDGVTCPALGEQCDDANADACDGCTDCHVDVCGDGIVCPLEGEECDPPDMMTCTDICHVGSGAPTLCTLGQDVYGDTTGRANGPSGLITLHPSVLPVTVGALGDLSLTVQNQAALECFLPTAGTPNLLCTGLGACGGDMTINACTNPPILDPTGGFSASGGQGSGSLAGEAIALKLSVALSDLGATSPGLKDFVLQPAFCVKVNGFDTYFLVDDQIADGTRTVADLLTLADQALRDGTSFNTGDPITRQTINDALHSVSDAFAGCRSMCSASGAFIDDEEQIP